MTDLVPFDFTLHFRLKTGELALDELVERLGACGCEDAMVGSGRPGRFALHFLRYAASAERAIFSALADVMRAAPKAHLIETAPDFVGLSEVAELIGVSRQNMRKLSLAHPDTFPAPVHSGNPSIWHLAAILAWLESRGTYLINAQLKDVANIAMQLNIAREVDLLSPRIRGRWERVAATAEAGTRKAFPHDALQ